MMIFMGVMFIQLTLLIILVLFSVAFFSLFERKLLSLTQSRKGPNKVSVWGVMQPVVDALKLIFKAESPPHSSIKFVYFLSPIFLFFLSSIFWLLYPVAWGMISYQESLLIIMIFYSLSVYGILLSGWFSNSKYATLGCGRALAQSISYEIGLTTLIIGLCLMFSSSSLMNFVFFQKKMVYLFFSLFPFFIMFILSFLAEMNRSPFDLAEGESELVSGYSVEYGGLSYTLIFLGENMALLWGSVFLSILFLSVWFCWVFVFFFVWIRASVPRIRFDKMMMMFWFNLLPLILALWTLVMSIW
nr:NADH dehydrogenase subunit 1 [Pessoaiella absita]